MDTELHKRLEEAAEKYANGRFDEIASRSGFIHGAEYGYKEAITQAKEWIINTYLGDYVTDEFGNGGIGDNVSLANDFEAAINKLWEGEK